MLKEAAVFDSEYGVDQHLRNLVITQYFAFSGFRRKIGGQDLGFELERIEQNAVTTNLSNLITRKRHMHNLLRSRGPDLDGCVDNNKTATPNVAGICFGITSTTQRRNELVA